MAISKPAPGWLSQIYNQTGGARVYMSHGDKNGMHINANNKNLDTYALECYGGDKHLMTLNGKGNMVLPGALTAGSSTVTGLLSAGSATVTNGLTAGSVTVTNGLTAGTISAGSGSISTTGALSAGSISISGYNNLKTTLDNLYEEISSLKSNTVKYNDPVYSYATDGWMSRDDFKRWGRCDWCSNDFGDFRIDPLSNNENTNKETTRLIFRKTAPKTTNVTGI